MRVPLRLWQVWVLTALCLTPAWAQRYTFKEYDEGLVNLNIQCMLQDRTGYLWLGTQNGLLRYDGSRFQEFGRADGLLGTFVVALHEDTSGRLWVGSDEGLFYLRDGRRFERVQYQGNNLEIPLGSTISSLPDGRVLAVSQLGLLLLKPNPGGGWESQLLLSKADAAIAGKVQSVLSDRDGSILFGCGDGFCRILNGHLTKWGAGDGLPKETWKCLLRDGRGQLWVRGPSHIAVLPPGASRFLVRDLPHSGFRELYLSLAEDRNGRVLTGLDTTVARYEKDHWHIFSHANGLSQDTVSSVLVDREGSVWFGLLGRGLHKWLGYGHWEDWTTANGLRNNVVWAIERDDKGRLWVGDEHGVSVMAPGSKQLQPWSAPGIETDRSQSIDAGNGSVWIGTATGNLIEVNTATLKAKQLRGFNDIYRVFVDSKNRVWVLTSQGLFRRDGVGSGALFARIHDPVVTDLSYSEICEDSNGRIWVAARDALYSFYESAWSRVDFTAKTLGGHISEMTLDHAGDIWLAGGFPGIARLRIRDNRVVRMEHISRPTLASELVVLLCTDSRGWLWVGSDHGIDVFDGRNWRRYTQDSGLVWNDTSSQAFFADGDGSVWIGTAGGVSHFLTPGMASSAPPPQPVFVWAKYGSKDLHGEGSLKYRNDPSDDRLGFPKLPKRESDPISLPAGGPGTGVGGKLRS